MICFSSASMGRNYVDERMKAAGDDQGKQEAVAAGLLLEAEAIQIAVPIAAVLAVVGSKGVDLEQLAKRVSSEYRASLASAQEKIGK